MYMDITLRDLEILTFYDSPQLVLGKCEKGCNYLCLAYDLDNYLCVKVGENDLLDFKEGKVDLLSLYINTEDGYYVGEFDIEGNLKLVIKLRTVSKAMLPESGFYLKP